MWSGSQGGRPPDPEPIIPPETWRRITGKLGSNARLPELESAMRWALVRPNALRTVPGTDQFYFSFVFAGRKYIAKAELLDERLSWYELKDIHKL